jgi:arylsulfatase
MDRPNVLFVMTDQQRFDTIATLGNPLVRTPNMDRLVARGVTFDNAYSPCPVCVPARYTIRSGCEPTRTGVYRNATDPDVHARIERDCGPYLAATMGTLGYRTFGVGKFHTTPWDAPVGFDVQLHSEELYDTPEQRAGDAYAAWLAKEHPEYDWVEALMGERTEMYYMPQVSPFPAAATVEAWAADRTVELIDRDDGRPWFGFVSFIGPHPPFAPPVPYNRMYDPDLMPAPVVGELAVDHLDQQIPWMNHAVFVEDIGPGRARALKARYYAEITYIDDCLGRILDAVEARPDADDTLICFFADHGDLLGDHHGWQKQSFFEASTRVPFLVSRPSTLPSGVRHDTLVALTDLFGVATTAAGGKELRQGVDVLGMLAGTAPGRERLYGFNGMPGTNAFKLMVREGPYKLIWMANGGRRLLFDVAADPHELRPIHDDAPEIADRLLAAAVDHLRAEGVRDAFDGDELASTEYAVWPRQRIYQFDRSRGVQGFSITPGNGGHS